MNHLVTEDGLHTGNVLSNKSFLAVDRRIVRITGSYNCAAVFAIILDRLQKYVDDKLEEDKQVPIIDGKVWRRITNEEITTKMMVVNEKTVRNCIQKLVKLGIVLKDNLGSRIYNTPDQCFYYSIEFEVVDNLITALNEGEVEKFTTPEDDPEIFPHDPEILPTGVEKMSDKVIDPNNIIDPKNKLDPNTLPKRTRRGSGFGVTKRKPRRQSTLSKEDKSPTEYFIVVEDEKVYLTKEQVDKVWKFIELNEIKMSEQQFKSWLPEACKGISARNPKKRGLVQSLKTWASNFEKFDNNRSSGCHLRSNKHKNGNIRERHTRNRVHVPEAFKEIISNG